MLIDLVDSTLREDGYVTRRRTAPPEDSITSSLVFESDVVLGLLVILPSPKEIVAHWERFQNDFVRVNARQLRLDPSRTANLYTVLMATRPATPSELVGLARIEEDLRISRKIVRAGVVTAGDVRRTLLPLLKVGASAAASPSDLDAALQAKLSSDEKRLFEFLRADNPDGAAHWLVEGPS